ncbi:hypothetical protein BB559_000737 [Furculomyces boomerangus]|uniref:Thioredoxin domain-containing protein n=1 Tax=Furculomyces boomerangus TaxID=61424 RepID=A0A2T9Z4A2_9FUNG|nr:hypothetical protein BB559_000737 [Furculomyces boomerangus]
MKFIHIPKIIAVFSGILFLSIEGSDNSNNLSKREIIVHKNKGLSFGQTRPLILNNDQKPSLKNNNVLKKRAQDENPDNSIVILTGDTFKDQTSTGKWLVKFFSPSCGACKMLQPIWLEVAKDYTISDESKKAKGIKFGSVNCLENYAFCTIEKIESWPTVRSIQNGEILDNLIGAVAKKRFNDFTEDVILTTQNFDEKVKQGIWFIKFYSPNCVHCKKLAPIWTEVTNEFAPLLNKKNIFLGEFNCQSDPKKCSDLKIPGYPTINSYNNGVLIEECESQAKEGLIDYIKGLESKFGNLGKEENKKEPAIPTENKKEPAIPNGNQKDAAIPNENKQEHEAPIVANKPVAKVSFREEMTQLPLWNMENVNGGVVGLGDVDYNKKTKESIWLINFYVPGCAGCDKLDKELEMLSKNSKNEVNIGKVNCNVYKMLCNDLHIEQFPTIRLVDKDYHIDYLKNEKTSNGLGYFLAEMGVSSKNINKYTSLNDLEDSLIDTRGYNDKKEGFMFVFIDANSEKADLPHGLPSGEAVPLAYAKLASVYSFNKNQFYLVKDDNLKVQLYNQVNKEKIQSAKEVKTPLVVAINRGHATKYPESIDSIKELAEWMSKSVKSFYETRVTTIDTENSDRFLKESDYLVLAVTNGESGNKHNDVIRAMTDSQAEFELQFSDDINFKGKNVKFGVLDAKKWDKYILRVFKLSANNIPAILVLEPKKNLYYIIKNISPFAQVKPQTSPFSLKTSILSALQFVPTFIANDHPDNIYVTRLLTSSKFMSKTKEFAFALSDTL